jgi:hypothetical protein
MPCLRLAPFLLTTSLINDKHLETLVRITENTSLVTTLEEGILNGKKWG